MLDSVAMVREAWAAARAPSPPPPKKAGWECRVDRTLTVLTGQYYGVTYGASLDGGGYR